MHFEQFIQDHLDFRQRMYDAMDETHGVEGVAAISFCRYIHLNNQTVLFLII